MLPLFFLLLLPPPKVGFFKIVFEPSYLRKDFDLLMFVFLLTEALSFLEVAAAPATEFLVELFYFLFLFSIRFESRKKFLTARMFLFIASWLANIGGRGEFGASESIREKLLFRC